METPTQNQNPVIDNFIDELQTQLLLYAEVHGTHDAINDNQPKSLEEFQVSVLNKTQTVVQEGIDTNQGVFLHRVFRELQHIEEVEFVIRQ